MTETVTYYSTNEKVSRDMAWLAYIVLPNGEYWGVRFNGATEEIARHKAESTWQHEQEKAKRLGFNPEASNYCPRVKSPQPSWDSVPDQNSMTNDPWASNKQHHRAGKTWMRHKETRALIAVALTEITMYEQRGFERSGPRSK